MQYDDIGIKVDHEKPNPRKKAMYLNYSIGKKIWEKEQAFNEAICNMDTWWAEKYDREIKKLYALLGILEDAKVEVKRYQ